MRDVIHNHNESKIRNSFIEDHKNVEIEKLKNGMMICANRGCGNTYITRKLLKDKAVFLATTNVA
jgi:hypothetical protein